MNALGALLALGSILPQMQIREEVKDWKLLRTDGFEIYYPDDSLKPRAEEFAGWFADAKARLTRVTGSSLTRTIHVFLYRSYHDLQQASFLGQFQARNVTGPLLGRRPVFPDRTQQEKLRLCRLPRRRALALAEPLYDRILIHCQASDRWNQWFLRHELAHQFQFEAFYPWRIPSYLIALKNPFIPDWFWEGYADFAAGIFESHKDEYVRDLSLERLYRLNELFSQDSLNFHDFRAPYYQGSYFLRFLDEQYGSGTSQQLFATYTNSFPYPMTRILGRATGKSVGQMEKEFAQYLETRYSTMMTGRADASDFARRVTDSRSYYRRRSWGGRFSPDGKRIAFVSNVETRPELYVASLDEASEATGLLGLRRGIDVGGIHSPPSWSPDGRRLVIAVSWRNHDYLLFADLEEGLDFVRLNFDEIYDPCFSPDGTSVVFSALKDGYSDLYVYREGEVKRLTEDRAADAMPAWSPDGNTIAYVSESDGRPQLHLLDLESRERTKLGNTYAVVEYPRWMPDGKSVVVSADVDGIFDLFRVDLEGSATRLTRVRLGTGFPDVSPDGSQILFTYFQGRGQDLYRMDFREEREEGFPQEERAREYDAFVPPRPQGEPAEKTRKVGMEYLMGPVNTLSFFSPGLEMRISDLDAENSIDLQSTFVADDFWTSKLTFTHTRWQPTFIESVTAGRIGDVQEITGGAYA